MQTVTTIGLDIAKSVFQVHGVDAAGQVVVRRKLKRRYVLAFFQRPPPCLVGIEACASSHYCPGTCPYRAINAASLREALRQTAEERYGRRRGDLRGGHQSQHAAQDWWGRRLSCPSV